MLKEKCKSRLERKSTNQGTEFFVEVFFVKNLLSQKLLSAKKVFSEKIGAPISDRKDEGNVLYSFRNCFSPPISHYVRIWRLHELYLDI